MQHEDQWPMFMLEPDDDNIGMQEGTDLPDFLHNSLSDIMEEEAGHASDVRALAVYMLCM